MVNLTLLLIGIGCIAVGFAIFALACVLLDRIVTRFFIVFVYPSMAAASILLMLTGFYLIGMGMGIRLP